MMIQCRSLGVVLFMLAAGQPASGQSDGWEKAQALLPGAKIELFLAGEKTVVGTLAEVSPDGLTLIRKRDSMQVAKSDIRRINLLGKGSRLRNTGIAALFGFGFGCPIGAGLAGQITDENNPRLGTRAGTCVVLGGLVGGIAAGVGAAVPASKRTLVYSSPAVKR